MKKNFNSKNITKVSYRKFFFTSKTYCGLYFKVIFQIFLTTNKVYEKPGVLQ